MQHVETVTTSEVTADILQSLVVSISVIYLLIFCVGRFPAWQFRPVKLEYRLSLIC